MDLGGSVEDQMVQVFLDKSATQQEVNKILLDQVVWLQGELFRLRGEVSSTTGERRAFEGQMRDQGERLRDNIATAKADGWATEAAGLLLVLVGTVLTFFGSL